MNSQVRNLEPDGTLFIVSGPSGAGKTTLINRVRDHLRRVGLPLHFSVSHTTREPRGGEVRGIDYHFVSREEFLAMIERGDFIEHAEVHGNLYGTSKTEVASRLDRGEDVILDIDVQGAQQIAETPELQPRSLSIFVFPPTFEELEGRIRGRNLNSEEEIEMRLMKAEREIEHGCNFYDYVIINSDIDVATECLKAAIIARKIKSNATLEKLRAMAKQFKEEHSGRTT